VTGAGDQRPAPDGCVIRAARLTDRHQLAELLTQLGYPQDESQVSERLLAWTGNATGTVLVAELDGSAAGVIAVHKVPYFERPGAFARIVALSVDGRRRRGGIGRRLVLAAEEWAAARGCVDMEVTSRRVRHDAHRFYAALGYEDECRRSGRLKRALAPPSQAAD
jgi:GNAT superfamily N-acetyltransferase